MFQIVSGCKSKEKTPSLQFKLKRGVDGNSVLGEGCGFANGFQRLAVEVKFDIVPKRFNLLQNLRVAAKRRLILLQHCSMKTGEQLGGGRQG